MDYQNQFKPITNSQWNQASVNMNRLTSIGKRMKLNEEQTDSIEIDSDNKE